MFNDSVALRALTLPGEIIKNDEALTLPVPAELIPILKKQFRKAGEPVFSGVNLRKEWFAACVASKCPELLIHDLRRSGVRNLILAGVPEKVAMTISGHKTRSVFDRYNIMAPKQLLDAMKQLEAYDGTLLKNDGTSIAPTKSGKGEKL